MVSMSQIAGKKMGPEVAKQLFHDGHDIKYRFIHSEKRGPELKGKWTGIRSYRKAVKKNSGVMWPWDMLGSPYICSVEWWVLD